MQWTTFKIATAKIAAGFLMWLAAGGAGHGQPAQTSLLPAPGFPQSIGMVAFDLPNHPGELGQFLAIGTKVWRRDFRWSWFEKQRGHYDFSFIEGNLQAIEGTGVRMLLILGGRNELYPGFGDGPEHFPTMTAPEQIPGFVNFAAAAAKQLQGKPVIFELGNELDSVVTPEQYVKWARATVQAMRQADPRVVVIGPGSHEWAAPWNEAVMKLGLLDLVDAVSVHLYLGGDAQKPQRMPESVEKDGRIKQLKDFVAKYSPHRDVPLVNSEWGYRTYHTLSRVDEDPNGDMQVSVTDQARYAARSMLLSVLWGLRFNVWFAWTLPAKGPGGYCPIEESGVPLPAYFAIKNLAAQLPDSTLERRIELSSPDDFLLEFKTSQGTRWAVWTCAEPHALNVPIGSDGAVVVGDLCGTRTFRKPLVAGQVNLAINGAVQYLRATGPDDQ